MRWMKVGLGCFHFIDRGLEPLDRQDIRRLADKPAELSDCKINFITFCAYDPFLTKRPRGMIP